MKPQKTPDSQNYLKKEEQSIALFDFKLYYHINGIVIETMWWHEDRHIVQENNIESPEVKTHIYSQLIFDSGAKKTQWEKR